MCYFSVITRHIETHTSVPHTVCIMYYNYVLQAKKSLKSILSRCTHLPVLEPLLHDAPPNILKHIVGQFSKVIDVASRLAQRVGVDEATLCKNTGINQTVGPCVIQSHYAFYIECIM